MKRERIWVGVFLLIALGTGICQGATLPNGRYFGQTPPGFTPIVFAPGAISLPNRFEYCLTFSPSMDECVFGLTNAGWSGFNLMYTKMASDSTWIDPIAAPFQGSGDATDPFYAPSGNEIYFVSSRPTYPPTNLWRCSREGAGWSAPVKLDPPINSSSNEWGGSVASDGTIVFCSTRPGGAGNADVYRAVTSPGGDVTVENLGATINTSYLEGSAFGARDGSYVIFESQKPGGYGQSDLYISFDEGGVWTAPRNLGPAINTSQIEDCPSISPDGKYMFFNRRRASYTTEPSEIWWVDARAVFHPEQSGVHDADPQRDGSRLIRIEPNPFVETATLNYSTPRGGFVSIEIYDILGRHLQSLVNAPRAAGTYSEELAIPPGLGVRGVYFCRLQLDDRSLATGKAISSGRAR